MNEKLEDKNSSEKNIVEKIEEELVNQ